ncbi:MAG: BTAD domain-containing putative transcriptional regulator [Actinomycetota bacterium]|jgi:DNA-binding SARP family transcriptional activator|nr:BTAD domain-containing putative transcriptional regulator [Actinomycetota bacterium]
MGSRGLGRLARLARGLVALVLLAALVAGVPWALWHYVGWPLPHHVPSAAQLGHVLDSHGIAGRTLVDALAVVVWVAWAVLVASVAAEIPAAVGGRRARRLPLAGAFQPLTGRLVAAVVVACLAVAPRPGPSTPTGSPAGGLVALRRPVAALVLTVDRWPLPSHAPPTRPPAADTAATGVAPASTPVPGPAAGATRTYVVRRGDTLWGIAERELGDPLRWSQIFSLNENRAQPGGATLTDPHWIDPGWTLLLPVAAPSPASPASPTPVPGSPTPTPVPPTASATAPAPSTPSIAASPTTTAPPTDAAPSQARHPQPASPARASGAVPGQADQPGTPVRLPSGSVVAGSFAAGVASAVALGRLRRRHAYRYRPPEPGRDLRPPPRRPTLDHLVRAASAAGADPETVEPGPVPAGPFDRVERIERPGHVDIGACHGNPVAVEVTDLCGVALCGPAADDIARAVVAALVTRAEPGAAEVLLTADLAGRLLPGLSPDPAIRRAADIHRVAQGLEAERIARTRRLRAVGAPDAVTFRRDNPENPLPELLVLADPVAPETAGRWAALIEGASRLGIAVVFLGPSPAATGRIVADADRTVTSAAPVVLAERLAGAELFGLRAGEAVELLGVVAESRSDENPELEMVFEAEQPTEPGAPFAVSHRPDAADHAARPAEAPARQWPQQPVAETTEGRPIVVEMLGPLRITVGGEAVASGLRSRARTLFAWYLLRPEGATSDEAVEALWPGTDPDGVLRQFWRSFGDLRTRFRSAGGDGLEVLEKTGEHYRAAPGEIACDYWDFQRLLADAARADDDETARMALARAVGFYRGDLLQGVGELWVEPVRHDLHRRCLDAHLRLAELEERAGRTDAAVAALERAIELDRYAEEPYRRLMALHAACGRADALAATWQLLARRLGDIDVDVDDATARLYRTLTAPDAAPDTGARAVVPPRPVGLPS